MLPSTDDTNGNNFGINFLEKNFSQLSVEGQSHLKDYLQSLVSLQNTISEKNNAENVHILLNRNQDGN